MTHDVPEPLDPPPLDQPPLDQEVSDLLRAEMGAVFAPGDAKARVRARLDLAALGPFGGGGGGQLAAPRAAVSGLLRRAPSLALAFLLGGVTGAWVLHEAQPATAPAIVYVDRASSSSTGVRAIEASGIDVVVPATTEVSALPVASAVVPASPAERLAEEQSLLDVARVALARRAGGDALAAVAKHERRFPNGALAEEREAIAVQALVLAKHADEARARAAKFAERYPESMLAPTIESALRTIR